MRLGLDFGSNLSFTQDGLTSERLTVKLLQTSIQTKDYNHPSKQNNLLRQT